MTALNELFVVVGLVCVVAGVALWSYAAATVVAGVLLVTLGLAGVRR